MKYSLGIDIGISSVGWAVLNLDEKRVEDLGVRAFHEAENPKTKAPLAEPRRIARGFRRRLRRKRGRLRAARELFIEYGLIDAGSAGTVFADTRDRLAPWQIRAEGLDRLLTGEEFARALLHIVKRRGFKSNRKSSKDADEGKMLAGIARNKNLMTEKGYRTAGEMYYLDEAFESVKRNRMGSYLNTIDRDTLKEEIVALFEAQRKHLSHFAGDDFQAKIIEIFQWQKPFASGDDILKNVGLCTFLGDEGELRAPKCSYYIERFNLLSKINNTSYVVNGDRIRLDETQRKQIAEEAYDKAKLTYGQIRKLLGLPDEARFTGLEYMRRPKKGQPREFSMKCEDAAISKMDGYNAVRKAFQKAGVWDDIINDSDIIDKITFALTFYKTDEDIANYLREQELAESVVNAALGCETFAGVGHISTKAAKLLIPHLEQGCLYSEACTLAGFDHSNPQDCSPQRKLPLITRELVNNPVVLRSLCQARRVINAVIGCYGPPYAIHVEFARDVGKSREQRDEIKSRQDENAKDRERCVEEFREAYGIIPNSTDLLKWRLYREQDGKCAYSQRQFDVERLCEPGYVEIDHILPYSRSFSDAQSNKVLVFTSENRNKSNRTPHEAFGSDTMRWDRFCGWVKATIKNPHKRANLLRTRYDASDEEEQKDRSLNDTRYAARALAGFIRANLQFADPEYKRNVFCISGFITAQARWHWGLHKDREENDLHHALDAAAIAALLPYQVKMITEWAKVGETGETYIDRETGEVIEVSKRRLPRPWPNFAKEVTARLAEDPVQAIEQLALPSYSNNPPTICPVVVSRMIRRKKTGQIHEETIRSVKRMESHGQTTVRKPLTELTADSIKKLICEEADPPLYKAIVERMQQFNNKGKDAFAEPLRKPTKDGSEGPIVRSVKMWQTQNTGIELRGGIADNGDMVRTDVFCKNGKYYLVPVYVSDILRKRLPNRAIVSGKPESEWPEMDESYEFLFTLHPYDLLWMEADKREGRLYYYRGSHRGTGQLKLSLPNGEQVGNDDEVRIGARNAKLIKKYIINVLGEISPAPAEKRIGLEDDSGIEPGEVEA